MIRGRDIWGDNGFTLTETMIAVCVITILVGLAGLEYSVWMQRYNVEREAREMYADFMNARARAMQRNRLHFVYFADGQYSIYEDTKPVPDGDGELDTASNGDAMVLQKRPHNIVRANIGGATKFYFKTSGLSSLNGSVRLISDVTAEYDCVVIYWSRLHLGRWDDSQLKCKATL